MDRRGYNSQKKTCSYLCTAPSAGGRTEVDGRGLYTRDFIPRRFAWLFLIEIWRIVHCAGRDESRTRFVIVGGVAVPATFASLALSAHQPPAVVRILYSTVANRLEYIIEQAKTPSIPILKHKPKQNQMGGENEEKAIGLQQLRMSVWNAWKIQRTRGEQGKDR